MEDQSPAGKAGDGRRPAQVAAANPLQSLCEEASCPICLGFFHEPVMTGCGHVFCRACLAQHWGGEAGGGGGLCPQCRAAGQKASLRPVRPLASIAVIARSLSGLQVAVGAPPPGKACRDHQEPLKLFCEDDQALLCVICDRSREHREHKVVPKKEAFEEHKGRIWDYLKFLKNEREEILYCKLKKENESQDLLKEAEIERQKIVAEFKKLHTFLEKNEELLLTKLKNLDSKIKDVRNKIVAKLSEEISSVDSLIKEMEEKHNQPEDEFLQITNGKTRSLARQLVFPRKLLGEEHVSEHNDIKSALQRCDRGKFVEPEASFLELRTNVQWFSGTRSFLDHVMKKFRDTVLSGLDGNKDIPVPKLVLSSVCYTQGTHRDYRKMYFWSRVMGVETVNSGRRSWVVDVGQRRYWTVGVAKEDLREQNQIHLSPNQGVWAVGKLSDSSNPKYAGNACYPLTSSGIPLGQFWIPCGFYVNKLDVSATRIRVSLDYEEGSVTFSDADQHNIIYIFKNASFAGAKLCFWLSESQLYS